MKLFANILIMLLLAHSVTLYAVENNKNNIYTENKPNIVISAANAEFTVKLKSNPTTGYSWFLREYDANLLTPVKHHFQRPEKNLIGAPGYELWAFRVKPAGFTVPHQTVIRFVYARPWQGADSSTQLVFRVTTIADAQSIFHR